MPPKPAEGISQPEILLRLRAAIDTAISHPSKPNADKALELARSYPQALRSSHVRLNLGHRRWGWLSERGITPVGESAQIAGLDAIKGTISPDIAT